MDSAAAPPLPQPGPMTRRRSDTNDEIKAVASQPTAKIIDKIRQTYAEGRVTTSFEFFPAKTAAGVNNLLGRIEQMGCVGTNERPCDALRSA